MKFKLTRDCAIELTQLTVMDFADTPIEIEVSRPEVGARAGISDLVFSWAYLSPDDARSLAVELVRLADRIDGRKT